MVSLTWRCASKFEASWDQVGNVATDVMPASKRDWAYICEGVDIWVPGRPEGTAAVTVICQGTR